MSGPGSAQSVIISSPKIAESEPSSPPPSPPEETLSSAMLADAISSLGVYMSHQLRAGITEESLGADQYRKMVSFYTRFDACYTQEASKVLTRKKSVFLAEEASVYMEEILRGCYRDACVDTFGRAAKAECEAAAE